MEKTEFKITGPGFYKTSGGFKAYVVGRSLREDGWLVEAINSNPYHESCRWIADDDGRSKSCSTHWFIIAEWVEPKRIKGWVNVYADYYPKGENTKGEIVKAHTCYTIHSSKEVANQAVDTTIVRIACIEIDVSEGQGLDGSAR